MPGLEYEMTYRLKVRGPLAATHGSPRGAREYWEMSEGTLRGPRIDASIAMPGADWFAVGADRFGRPDVRVQFMTVEGSLILLHYTGLVERTAVFTRAAEAGTETKWTDQYMRMTMSFDTGAEKYAWLNENLFIGEGRLAGRLEIEYDIYRVT
jgi:hypothetical protein